MKKKVANNHGARPGNRGVATFFMLPAINGVQHNYKPNDSTCYLYVPFKDNYCLIHPNEKWDEQGYLW